MNQKEVFSPYQLEEIERWKNYVEECRPILRSKFELIIKRYDIGNIKKLKGNEAETKELMFFHGSGELTFSIEAVDDFDSYDNHQYIYENEYLFPEFEDTDISYDFLYPDELDPFLEDYREGKVYDLRKQLLFQMMLDEWSSLGGHKIGIKVGTLENNAAATFDFVKYNWEDYLPNIDTDDRLIEYPYLLPRDLSSFEIQKRLEYNEYNPYKTLWRYFVNGDQFAEYAIYDNFVGYRSGHLDDFSNVEFDIRNTPLDYRENRFDNKVDVLLKCEELLNQGFTEVARPVLGPKLFSNLIEWEYHSITNKDYLDEKQINKLKKILPSGIPETYFFFIKRMYNIGPKWEFNSFKINHREWRRIKTIISPFDFIKYHEVYSALKTNGYIPIFEDEFGHLACIDSRNNTVIYLTLGTKKDLEVNFETFIGQVCGISENFDVKQYHLQNNNLTMVKRWIDDGWNVNEKIGDRDFAPIQLTRRHELIEILLKNGADPNKVVLSNDVELKTLLLVIEYGIDLKQNLANRDYLRNNILANPDFEAVHKHLE